MKKLILICFGLSIILLSCSKSDNSIDESKIISILKEPIIPPNVLSIDMGGQYWCPDIPVNCLDEVVITPTTQSDFMNAVINDTVSSYLDNSRSAWEAAFTEVATNYSDVIDDVISEDNSIVYISPSRTDDGCHYYVVVPTSEVEDWDVETDVILVIRVENNE